MTLTSLTEEEKLIRKRKQKAEAQKRYYQKHKDYYKDYNIERTRRTFASVKKAKERIALMLMDDISDETRKALNYVLEILIEEK